MDLSKEEIPINLLEFFKLSDSVIEGIVKVAIAKFGENESAISLVLFTLLSTLNPENFDYLYRLGIAAQRCKNYDLALKAYREAFEINPELIGARLFSIECYLAKDLPENAKEEMRESKKIAGNIEFNEMWVTYIAKLEKIMSQLSV